MHRLPQQSPSRRTVHEGARSDKLARTQISVAHECEDEDEDEETLKLKLQAIEARIKLKRMRNRRLPKDQDKTTDIGDSKADDEPQTVLPKSPLSPVKDQINVPRSPLRRPTCSPKHVHRSPSRLLGIDKGLIGRNVMLTKPPANASSRKQHSLLQYGGSSLPKQGASRVRPSTQKSRKSPMTITSFNARMNEKRENEQDSQTKRQKRSHLEALRQNRKAGFGVNKAQLAEYKTAAATDKDGNARLEHSKKDFSHAHIMQVVQGSHRPANLPRMSESQDNETRYLSSTPHSSGGSELSKTMASAEQSFAPEDLSTFDPVSATALSARTLPHAVLTKSLRDKVIVDIIGLLRHVRKPEWAIPESLVPDGKDFVILGILGSKTHPLDHKDTHRSTDRDSGIVKTSIELADDSWRNESRKYMVLTLVTPDLRWSIHLFLFSTAYSRWHNLKIGTLIAILNPGIMPPPPGRTDTNQWSLKISSSEDIVLEIGASRDMAWCHAIKQDGRACGQWIDGRRFAVCEFHAAKEVDKLRGARMETQGGGFSGGVPSKKGKSGLRGQKRGRDLYVESNDDNSSNYEVAKKFDRWANSTYYMKSDGVSWPESTARMLDTEEVSRNRASGSAADRTRKLFADREKEAEIARQLGMTGTGAGAEYMRSQSRPQNDQANGGARAVNSAAGLSTSLSQLSRLMRNTSPDMSKTDLSLGKDLLKRKHSQRQATKTAAGTSRRLCGNGDFANGDESDELEIV